MLTSYLENIPNVIPTLYLEDTAKVIYVGHCGVISGGHFWRHTWRPLMISSLLDIADVLPGGHF